jgi:hypothetical protein
MNLYEVIKAFTDIDGEIKTVGMIIEVASNRVDKLISQGYVIPVPRETIDSLLKTINGKLGENTQLWGHETKTVLGYNNAAYKHIHNPSYVWPDDCTLVSAVSSATADTFGDFVELIGEGDIDRAFDIHWANIENITENGVYIVELHEVSNADLQVSEKYLGLFSVSRRDNFTRSFTKYTQIPVVSSNKRIGARVKKSGAGAGTVVFNVEFHDYA